MHVAQTANLALIPATLLSMTTGTTVPRPRTTKVATMKVAIARVQKDIAAFRSDLIRLITASGEQRAAAARNRLSGLVGRPIGHRSTLTQSYCKSRDMTRTGRRVQIPEKAGVHQNLNQAGARSRPWTGCDGRYRDSAWSLLREAGYVLGSLPASRSAWRAPDWGQPLIRSRRIVTQPDMEGAQQPV